MSLKPRYYPPPGLLSVRAACIYAHHLAVKVSAFPHEFLQEPEKKINGRVIAL